MGNSNKTPLDILLEKGYDDVLVYSSPSYENALIGLSEDYCAVYDFSLMIDWLVETEDMTEDDAADFICFNDSFYYGVGYPIIYYGDGIEELIADDNSDYTPLVFTKIEDLPYKYFSLTRLLKNIFRKIFKKRLTNNVKYDKMGLR